MLKSVADLGLNVGNNEDCKKYILEYEQYNQIWLVYNSGWKRCKVIDIENNGLLISKATVLTEKGYKITREVKFCFPGERRNENYIYFLEKEEIIID